MTCSNSTSDTLSPRLDAQFWGGCPQCYRNDGYVSERDDLWFYCIADKLKWTQDPFRKASWLCKLPKQEPRPVEHFDAFMPTGAVYPITSLNPAVPADVHLDEFLEDLARVETAFHFPASAIDLNLKDQLTIGGPAATIASDTYEHCVTNQGLRLLNSNAWFSGDDMPPYLLFWNSSGGHFVRWLSWTESERLSELLDMVSTERAAYFGRPTPTVREQTGPTSALRPSWAPHGSHGIGFRWGRNVYSLMVTKHAGF